MHKIGVWGTRIGGLCFFLRKGERGTSPGCNGEKRGLLSWVGTKYK